MAEGQSISQVPPFSLSDFEACFPDETACLDFLKEKRYPGGVAPCARCGRERRHHRVRGRRAYACDSCGSMISPAAGTIFEESSTSLRTWFYAVFRATTTRGLTAKQLQRETGVTYKTAWRMMSRIRELLTACLEPVRSAETWIACDAERAAVRPDFQLILLFLNPPCATADAMRKLEPAS